MKIFFNGVLTNLPKERMTLEELLEWKNIKRTGIAVSLNNRIVRKDYLADTVLNDMDQVTIITAAFGG